MSAPAAHEIGLPPGQSPRQIEKSGPDAAVEVALRKSSVATIAAPVQAAVERPARAPRQAPKMAISPGTRISPQMILSRCWRTKGKLPKK